MCKKSKIRCGGLIYLVSFVLVLGLTLTSTANAADPNLVGYWRFDEGSGTIAFDSSGNDNHGTITGAEWVAGQLGGALSFNGVDYVTVPSETWSSIEKYVTIACWVYGDPDLQPRNDWLFGAWGVGRVASCHLPWSDGTVYWDTGATSTDSDAYDRISKAATPDEYEGSWQHWAFTKDVDTGEQKIYLNGVLWHSVSGLTRTMTGITAFTIGSNSTGAENYAGMIDDFQLYNRALTEEEIQQAMIGPLPGQVASDPSPGDGATDVPRDVVLSWRPGEFANTHDVHLGTDFDDVNDADRTTPLDVLVSQNQVPDSYSPAELLQFSQTYYWRIDEVNAPPDFTLYKGDVWDFTAEPVAYPIAGELITATASSSNSAEEGPENTINGSELDADDLHSAESMAMWLSSALDPNAAWLQYEFDRVYKLHQMRVWNHNTLVEAVIGFGVKDGTIEYSLDGTNWTTLGTTHEFARAPGAAGYAHNTTVDLGGAAAKYVKLTANSNWGGLLPQYGLSEVRFLYIPVQAREPNPASGATDVDVDLVLSFRAGREAAEHNVYISTDEQAVIDSNVPVSIVTEAQDGPISLDLDETYYWKVNEVNMAETPTMLEGDLWNFTTQESLVVDDFELYNDLNPDEPGSNRIFLTWIDGYDNPAINGSVVGYAEAPFTEQSIVHGGSQSMPFYYDNSTASYSEATVNIANLPIGQDWTKHGVKALTLRFHGDPTNAVQQVYVKLNGSKVIYDGEADNITRTGWQMWYIDLADFGVNLSNVTELNIGLERSGVAGGSGVVYFDDIRLYPFSRQLITPAEPDTAGLVGHWQFEGNFDDNSGNGHHGTVTGNPTFVAGKIGQAASFDGVHDFVSVPDNPSMTFSITDSYTLTAWVYIPEIPSGWSGIVTKGRQSGSNVPYYGIWIGDNGGIPTWFYGLDIWGNPVMFTGWVHIAVVQDGAAGTKLLCLSGTVDSQTAAQAGDAAGNLVIGSDQEPGDSFTGMVDDVRIYSRALSQAEVAWLAGRTKPFDKPF